MLELELLYQHFLSHHPPQSMSHSDVLDLEAIISHNDDLGILNCLMGRVQTPEALSHNKLFERFAHFVSERKRSR